MREDACCSFTNVTDTQPVDQVREVARLARERVIREHSAERRAAELEEYVREIAGSAVAARSLEERPAS